MSVPGSRRGTRPPVSREDQFSGQDPTTRHPAPGSGEKDVEHRGLTGDLDVRPDHGEKTYRGSGRLEGRKAVITGGDSGIGRAVALAFAREGADVLISYLPDEEEDGRETVRLIEEAGRTAVAVPGDLVEEANCRAVVDRAVEAFGRIDVLVSNAAYQMTAPGGLEEISTEQLDRVFKTNLYALFWLCKAAVPHIPPGGSIITSSSVQAFTPLPQLLDYATTKGGIVTFTKGLAAQLAQKGIRVNSVAPGPVWTPLIPATIPGEQLGEFGAQTPLGRAAQPAEMAPFYVFLASGESGYMTAQVLGATGGTPIT
jgi:NAD(P)-dependent dehydrogenase (short-subunit alcohol dehydrogenase family)